MTLYIDIHGFFSYIKCAIILLVPTLDYIYNTFWREQER